MPTTRPRLTVTLTPQIDRALTAFSKGTGTSKGAFILSILEGSLPILERLAVTVQAAKNATPEALGAIKANMFQLAKAGERAMGGIEMASDLFLEPLPPAKRTGKAAGQRPAPGGRSPSRKPGTRPAVPPPSNRGVGTPPGPSKVTSIRSRSRD